MKRLLLVLILIAVAISGCTEKGPSVADKSAEELKTLSIAAAENLTSYSLKSSLTQMIKHNSIGTNESIGQTTTYTENDETIQSVDLSGYKSKKSYSIKTIAERPGYPENSTTSQIEVYQVGNSTYFKDGSGNWTHLKDLTSAGEIWEKGNFNQVKAQSAMINNSQMENAGSETIDGQETYKMKIVTGIADYNNLYDIAFDLVARPTNYMAMPSINKTELNETSKIEKIVWISKDSYLPVKYQSSVSFEMKPELIAALDLNTGQMMKLNQSIRLGEISVSIETDDLYYDFDKPTDIAPPEQALFAPVVTPTQIQTQAAVQA